MRPLNRILPRLPVTAMQTYAIDAPPATHFRPATCAEAACIHREQGWKTIVDEATTLGQQQAAYIRRHAGRHFRESREGEGVTTFTFPAGQDCFREHRVRVDRPEIFSVSGGDYRGRTTSARILPAHGWVDDMQEGLYRLHRLAERG